MEILAGPNSVREALRAGRRRLERVMLAEGGHEKGAVADIIALCRERKIPLVRLKRPEMDRLSEGLMHQGVAAQATPYPYAELDDLLTLAKKRGEPPLLLALDSLQDPQNVGSLLRTAEAVGVHGVLIPERRAVGITPAVSRASAGAVEHLLAAQVTNLTRALEQLKEAGVWVAGVEARPSAQDYRRVNLNVPLVLVLGSEGRGLGRLITETCDLLLRIPMRGQVESLNVSVAGSLVLYEAWNARRKPA